MTQAESKRLHGLYVITDSKLLAAENLIAHVEEAILGGARVVQYRDKSDDHALRLKQALDLQSLCQNHQIPLIINDDIALAKRVGAAGVHLGKHDQALELARFSLGPSAIIGISCYNDLKLAEQAQMAGADYIALGSFFPSPTKPNAVRAEPSTLRNLRRSISVPICAIGGITPENGGELVQSGADMLAVISGVFAANSIHHAAQNYSQLFT